MFACIVQRAPAAEPQALLRLADSFSPRVEVVAVDAVVLDIEGLGALFGAPDKLAQTIAERAAEAGLQVSVAVAGNLTAALLAARGNNGITVIPPGGEAGVLRNLPLRLLDASPEMQQTWKLWGLRSFGDLAALPQADIAERLGQPGVRLHRAARGIEDRLLFASVPPADFHASAELEHPVELLEPLAFILARLLNEVCARLEAEGKAASQIKLRLKVQDPAQKASADFERHLSLPVPLCDREALLKLLWLDLESHPPQAPVVAASLEAEAARPRVLQNGLFVPPAPEPEKLELTLARIAKLVGAENVGSPQLLDTHRPDAFQMRPFRLAAGNQKPQGLKPATIESYSAWLKPCPDGEVPYSCSRALNQSSRQLSVRVFRPPLPAEVECLNGEPLQIRARGIRGNVVSSAGPWRSSGDWWTLERWEREEWDVELQPLSRKKKLAAAPSAKGVYRVYREIDNGCWYIEGNYD